MMLLIDITHNPCPVRFYYRWLPACSWLFQLPLLVFSASLLLLLLYEINSSIRPETTADPTVAIPIEGTRKTRAGTPWVAMVGANSQARHPAMYPHNDASNVPLLWLLSSLPLRSVLLVSLLVLASALAFASSSNRLRKDARMDGKTASPSPRVPVSLSPPSLVTRSPGSKPPAASFWIATDPMAEDAAVAGGPSDAAASSGAPPLAAAVATTSVAPAAAGTSRTEAPSYNARRVRAPATAAKESRRRARATSTATAVLTKLQAGQYWR
mmetsp:Transcript_3355/g.7360  ORF Transcript_3355/g.7360 Transcript_3355/m.7360 type:complete len:269 (-) Transcript_3355:261-1067(-)